MHSSATSQAMSGKGPPTPDPFDVIPGSDLRTNGTGCNTGGPTLTIHWSESFTSCLDGFYCPNIDEDHPPQLCMADEACLVERLGRTVCKHPQGIYEPTVCRFGHVCPPGGKTQVPCPNGHFCPLGSAIARKCSIGSLCPEGSAYQLRLLPLLLTLGPDFLVLAALAGLYAYKHFARSRRRQSAQIGLPTASDDIEGVRTMNPFFDNDSSTVDQSDEDAAFKSFVGSVARCVRSNNIGLSFTFRDLECEPKPGKKILSGVSGTIRSGSMWGVMGGSGAGKTTFINVLMGRLSHTCGEVLINGYKSDMSQYKKLIGYVPQDDIVLPDLTVRENLMHSARVRLPSTWTSEMIREHVDNLISCLALTNVRNRRVGSPDKPSISGGQRKRVSIGIELAAAPMALLLDEPTSGLDATSAGAIIRLLKKLSNLGVTTIAVMHQPREQIFSALDNLLLLSEGRQVYAGPTHDVVEYFESLGFKIPTNDNPADVLIDIATGRGQIYMPGADPGDSSVARLVQEWQNHTFNPDSSKKSAVSAVREVTVTDGVLSSETSSETIESGLQQKPSTDIVEKRMSLSCENLTRYTSQRQRGASRFKQTYYCCRRAFIQQFRDKSGTFFEMLVATLMGALIGLSASSSKGQFIKGIYHIPFHYFSTAFDYNNATQIGLLSAVALGCSCATAAVRTFGEEKLVYWRETAAGQSRSAYYIGKVISTLPRIALCAVHFTVVMAFISKSIMPLTELYLANLLYVYCAYGLASCVSVLVRREHGPILAVFVAIAMAVIGGVSPPMREVKKWELEWLWRLSPGVWFTEAYFSQHLLPFSPLYQVHMATVHTGLRLNQYGKDMLCLFAIGTFYRIACFVGLIMMDRRKQK